MRENPELCRYVAYGIVVAGFMLSFAQAIVPQIGMTGYRLAFGIFAWAIVPYVVYLFLTDIVHGFALLVPGTLMLAINAVIAWSGRFGPDHPAVGTLLQSVPVWLTFLVLPLGVLAGRLLSLAIADAKPPLEH
jgi:hypothetical protein